MRKGVDGLLMSLDYLLRLCLLLSVNDLLRLNLLNLLGLLYLLRLCLLLLGKRFFLELVNKTVFSFFSS